MAHLTTLNLSGNGFGGSLTNIVLAPKLQVMDVSGNKIAGSIPVSSGWFLGLCETTLQHLDLSDNKLDGTLPDLGAYTQLEYADLSNNKLTGSIQSEFNNLNLLQTLDLSQNRLAGSIPALAGLSQLQEMNLSSNNLSGTIPVNLGGLGQLETVDLNSNHFTGVLFEFPATLHILQIQSNDLDFSTSVLGMENSNYVKVMLDEGIDVNWLKQNGPLITSQPKDESVPNGHPDPFSVTVEGAPPLSYQWQFDGSNLTDNSRIDGSTNATLSINPVELSDEGAYQIIITNAYGSITSDFAMLAITTAGVAPQITSPETNESVNVGQSAAFLVSTTGSSPLLYEWFLDGTNISGATTPTLAITSAALSNAGSYTVIVSNSFGAATNLAGTLSVATAPLLFATNGTGIQFTNGIVVLQVSGLTGGGTAEVEVSGDLIHWLPISTNSTDSGTIQIIDTNAAIASQSYYRVVVFP